MSMHTVAIGISFKELEERRKRCEMARRFEKPDRVPVTPLVDTWYWLPRIGKSYEEYFSSAKSMLECQLAGQKWHLENVKSDHYQIRIHPVYCYVSEAATFGCEVEFRKDNIPWVKSHWIENDDDLAKLEKMDPIHGGLHGRELALREEMLSIAGNYKIRFTDGVEMGIEDKIGISYGNFSYASGISGIGVAGRTIGVMLMANDLRGAEGMMTDLILRPDYAARLLSIITDKIIQWVAYTKELLGEPREGVFVGDDGAANLSPELYRTFLLPLQKRMKAHFGGYTTFHADAKADHILPIVAEELGIDDFSGFGFADDRELVARLFGGKVVLSGNINPMNLESGTRETIMEECRNALEHFAPLGGFFLKDGDNIPPATPLENINLLHEAAVRYGRY
jgi:uroporphyrinogen-III decarboxylase